MSSPNASSSYPARSDKALWRDSDGCVVVFHEDDGRAYALDENASAVWKLCDGSRSIADIGANTADVDDVVLREVGEVVTQLGHSTCLIVGSSANVQAQPSQEAPAPNAWSSPVIEEIVFAGCDCTSSGKGVMRNAECVPKDTKQATSTT